MTQTLATTAESPSHLSYPLHSRHSRDATATPGEYEAKAKAKAEAEAEAEGQAHNARTPPPRLALLSLHDLDCEDTGKSNFHAVPNTVLTQY